MCFYPRVYFAVLLTQTSLPSPLRANHLSHGVRECCLTKQSPPDTPAASSSSSRQAETATIRTKKFLSNPLLSRKQMVRALILEALTVWLLRSGVVEGPLLLVCAIWPRTRKCAHSSQQPCWCGHPHERSSVVMSILQALPMSRIDAIE